MVRIEREGPHARIRHNLIAVPGVKLAQVRKVISHPVALSQCRRFLASHPEFEVIPFYDTAGSVKHLMEAGLRDVAGIAPELAAKEYGADVLVPGVEDHAENFTRFHLVLRESASGEDAAGHSAGYRKDSDGVNKMSVAFAIEHRPGTLVVAALERLKQRARGVADLTKMRGIETRAGESVGVRVLCGCAVRYGGEGGCCTGSGDAEALPNGEGAGTVSGGVEVRAR